MKMLRDKSWLIERLNKFHKKKSIKLLSYKSDIAGNQFPGEFNVSGFHNEVLSLSKNEDSFFGVDDCLRLKENVGPVHSNKFSMGIFARSKDLKRDFINPFEDSKFSEFQESVLFQFFDLLKYLKINFKDIEVTYLGDLVFGSKKDGRDKILKREYRFPKDKISMNFFKDNGIKSFKVNSIANLDIRPFENMFVGPRIEVAYRGIEIATIVFDCFKICGGKLIPINYVGGYAIGVERLLLKINNKSSLLEINKAYRDIYDSLVQEIPCLKSSLFKEELHKILFGIEAISSLKSAEYLSKKQKDLLRKFNLGVRNSCELVGLRYDKKTFLPVIKTS